MLQKENKIFPIVIKNDLICKINLQFIYNSYYNNQNPSAAIFLLKY